jgi:GT2 family glycosyltransferase
VTGKIMRRDRPELIWHAGGHIDMLRVMGVPRGNNEVDRGQYDQPCDTEWASGAMMLMRRALLEDIGLLPEEYFFGQEEWDFSTAALRAGWRIRYVPEFAGVHDQGGSYAPGHPVLIVYNGGRNKLIYAEKYLPRILWQPWRALYWLYLRVWWPRRARWHGSTASDYKARIVAADLAFRDHTRGARVQLADLLAAGQKIGPTVSWGSNWARQG